MLKILQKLWRDPPGIYVDRSHVRTAPERSPWHLLFVLLFTFSVFAAMWQYCHAGMTLFILIAILPVSLLSFVPYKYIGESIRFGLQLVFFAVVIAWTYWAVKNGLISDRISLVVLGCTGVTFLMGNRKRDYAYLFIISTILMIYASLLARVLFLYLFTGFFLGCILLFFGNRLINISGDFKLKMPETAKRPKGIAAGFFHILFTFVFAIVIFFMLPKLPTEAKGVFEVSFQTHNDTFAPEDLQKWFFRKDTPKRHDAKSKFVSDGKFVDTFSKDAAKEANIPNAPTQKDGDGSGSATAGTPGKDLLFTFKSSLKLYHVGRIYNQYDGKNWTLSRILARHRMKEPFSKGASPFYTDLEFRYQVMKMISPVLYAPYLPVDFNTADQWHYHIRNLDHFGAQLKGWKDLPLPFRYSVTVRLFDFSKLYPSVEDKNGEKKKFVTWVEGGNARMYLSLPGKKISKRLRNYTKDLVKAHATPYEKAIAIRDHLRQKFPYKLHAGKVPPKKESVDYFIFELKEGHCEYFASAMAVMARLAGIPSRLVTGFSPGNYNTLTNLFEIYEYHAHAWTQLYFPEHGWLTFDATPPAEVVSRTTPVGLGSLRDPFGDEWRVTPPELTSSTKDFIDRKYQALLKENEKNLQEIARAAKDFMQNKETLKKANFSNAAKGKRKVVPKRPTLQRKIRSFYRDMKKMFRKVKKDLPGFFRKHFPAMLLFLLLICVAGGILLGGLRYLRNIYWYGRMRRFFLKAECPDLPPEERLRSLYFAVRLLLFLAGYPRKDNKELLAYAAAIGQAEPEAGDAVERLFTVFYLLEYGGKSPEGTLLESLIGEAAELQRLFRDRLKKKTGF